MEYYPWWNEAQRKLADEAKKVAAQSGKPFTDILSEGQKRNEYPSNPVID